MKRTKLPKGWRRHKMAYGVIRVAKKGMHCKYSPDTNKWEASRWAQGYMGLDGWRCAGYQVVGTFDSLTAAVMVLELLGPAS